MTEPKHEHTKRITIAVGLREGESVRIASGGSFVRLDVTAQGTDSAKVQAIRAAREAGVITEAEERHKLVDMGQYVTHSWMWSDIEYINARRIGVDVVSEKAEELLSEVRSRIDEPRDFGRYAAEKGRCDGH